MKFATVILASALAVAPALAQQQPAAKAQRAQAPAPRPMRVVIDAGHGGADKGVTADGQVEKDTSLQMAIALRAELEKRGVQVVLTRATDSFLPLAGRVRVADEVKPDCFVSLHTADRSLSARSRESAPRLDLFYFSPESKALASAMSPSITSEVKALGLAPSVKISRQRFFVLRQAAPSVFVSLDASTIAKPAAQARLVRALADGTQAFLAQKS